MSQEKENMNLGDKLPNNQNVIINICRHEWIIDYIDISPELSQTICYCVNCEVTKG